MKINQCRIYTFIRLNNLKNWCYYFDLDKRIFVFDAAFLFQMFSVFGIAPDNTAKIVRELEAKRYRNYLEDKKYE